MTKSIFRCLWHIFRHRHEVKKFVDFIHENYDDFDIVFNNIKKYIDFTLKCQTQINDYVPNRHIAEIFKEVLQACEKESMYPEIYHNVKTLHF